MFIFKEDFYHASNSSAIIKRFIKKSVDKIYLEKGHGVKQERGKFDIDFPQYFF